MTPTTETVESVQVRLARERYRTEVQVGPFRLLADEPASVGGSEAGPTPYALLLAALGTCKAITLRMYADRKGWPLDEVRLALRHDRQHPQDCEGCEHQEQAIERIHVELTLLGPLSVEQRARLAEVADRCPVHRTLTGPLRIDTSLTND